MLKIFIADDDLATARLLQYHLSLNPDNDAETFNSGKALLAQMHRKPDVITLDYFMNGETGAEILSQIRKVNAEVPVIIISGQQDINTAVGLLKQGAWDYIVKDDNMKDRLWNIINHIRNHDSLMRHVSMLQEEVETKYEFSKSIIGESPAIRKVFPMMQKAAASDIVVSVNGETGTGKEMVAKAIHFNSARKNKPFVAVNVAAIPHELIESELFGHEKGAFTGAVGRRAGKFEEAGEGTIFLDEIGDMDMVMQAKLLRVLQEQEITRIGGNDVIKVKARVIIATHRNLADEVDKGNFREDLYYRLLGIPIYLPPLRERGNDIAILANFFIKEYAKKTGIKAPKISPEAINRLTSHAWPGNIRELKAVMELAVVMTDSGTITPDHLQIRFQNFMSELLSKEMKLEEYERAILIHYLKRYNNRVRKVADVLGIGKSTIYRLFPGKKPKDGSVTLNDDSDEIISDLF